MTAVTAKPQTTSPPSAKKKQWDHAPNFFKANFQAHGCPNESVRSLEEGLVQLI